MKGRPTKYTPALGAEICKRIADGESLNAICKDDGMPHRTTVHDWLLDPEKAEFTKQYQIAVDLRAETLFEEILEIADDGNGDYHEVQREDGSMYTVKTENVQRSRLRVDSRKWYLSKVQPKKYGDKLDLTSGGKTLPTPILTSTPHALPTHDRNKKGRGADEED